MWKQREASVRSTFDELREQASRLRQDLSSSLARTVDEFDSRARELEDAESGLGQVIDELQRARQEILDIFEASPNAYVVTDGASAIVEVNRSAAKLLDTLPAALVGQIWPAVLGPATIHSNGEATRQWSDVWSAHASPDRTEIEIQITESLRARVTRLPDRPGTGRRLLWHLSAAPRGAPLEPQAAPTVGTANPATGTPPNEFVQRAFEEVAVGIVLVVGTGSEQVFLNRCAARLLGRPDITKSGLGRYDPSVYFPSGRSHAISSLYQERILRGKSVIGETAYIRARNGTQRWIRICGAPVTDETGKQVGGMFVVDDVTAVHEEQRQRAEWLSVIVHDLRAPLAIISGYAQLLQKDIAHRVDQGSEPRALETIRANTVRLNRMVSDLLDASRIEISKLSLQRQRVDLVAVVRRIAEDTQHTTPDRPVEIVGPQPSECPVLIDPTRIEQVLENLLQNAIKYGTPGTTIQLGVDCNGQTARVWVANQGPGIPPEERSQLFRQFHRSRVARTSKSGGLGLGLYIARGIVEAHGGKIAVESVPNQITTFTITLPTAVSISTHGIQNAW